MKNWKEYALCLGTALLLAACVPKPDGLTRIQFSFWGSLEQQAIEEEIVKAFETENPDIKIELLPIGARYAEKVQAMMIGKIAPDVIMVEMNQYAEWSARGALLDLTDLVKDVAAKDPIMPVPAKAFERDGKYFAFPANCSGQAMYCNLDALKKAGINPDELRTWDDVRRAAPLLSKRAGQAQSMTDYALLMPPHIILFWEYGVQLFDDDLHPTRVTVNTPAALACLEAMRKINQSGYAVPPDVANDQGTYQLFRDGKVALYFDGRWRTPNFAGQTAFAWDVRPMPAGPVRQVTLHGGTGLAVAKDSRNREAALRFLKFYVSKYGAAHAMKGGRYVPVYRDMAFGEFLTLRPPPHIRVFAETMEKEASQFLFYGPGASEIATIFGSRMEQALDEKEVPSAEIIQALEKDLERWLKRQKRKGLL